MPLGALVMQVDGQPVQPGGRGAVLAALGEDASHLSDDAVSLLCRELAFVLLVLLKRLRMPYRPEIGLAPLAAPIVLLAARHASRADAAAPSGASFGAAELAACRSDTLNAVAATLAKLCPATVAGAPWGLSASGQPSAPPNEALVAQVRTCRLHRVTTV